MSVERQYVAVAAKASTGVELVFAVRDDLRDASLIVERLRCFGIKARVEVVRPGTAWAGASWPVRVTERA